MAWFMERNIRRDEFVRSVVFVVALVAVFVMAALTFIPFNPSMPTSGLDPSWTLAMNQAVAAHLVFGRDVIFTFGPYASGYTTLYHPSTDTMMMFSATLLVISYCLALLYTIRTSTAWILFPIVIFLISYLNRDAFLITLPLAILFAADEIVWSRKDKLSPAARTLRASAVLVMVAALAMLPLIKGSFGLSVLALGVIALIIVWRKNRTTALSLVVLVVLFTAAFWGASGQPISALPRYFIAQQPIVSGYSSAMSVTGDRAEAWLFAIAALATLAAGSYWAIGQRQTVSSLLLLGVGLTLFLAFKEGFVRHDGHATIAGAAALLIGTLLSSRLPFALGFPVVALSAAIWIAILSHYGSVSPQAILANIGDNLNRAVAGVAARARGHDFRLDYHEALRKIRSEAAFKSLTGPSDIYPFDEAFLIASGLDWDPRPILQSYVAFTPALLQQNRDHLTGSRAPEHILFRVSSIDQRLASLDDAPSWPTLLTSYQFERFDNGFAVLTRQPSTSLPRFDRLTEAVADFDRAVELPQDVDLLWAKIDLVPSLKGRAKEFFYKLSPIIIRLKFTNGDTREFRYIPGIGTEGFLLSPWVGDTLGFVSLMSRGGRWSLTAERPVSMTLLAPVGERSAWRHPFLVTLSRLEVPVQPKAEAAVINGWGAPQGFSRKAASEGECTLDNISANRISALEAAVSGSYLRLSGWYVPWQTAAPGAIVLGIAAPDGDERFAAASVVKRPDVGAYFGRPELVDVGFSATLDISGVSFPSELRIYAQRNGKLAVCPFRLHLTRSDEPPGPVH
jgi:hypothetical protein